MTITIDPIVGFAISIAIGAAAGTILSVRRHRALNNRYAAFSYWWHNTGSGIPPLPGEETESHARRVAAHAWDAGFAQRDAA